MDFQKFQNLKDLPYLRVLWAQKQCSKFQCNFGLSTKKVIGTQKCTQTAWPLLFCQFLTSQANFVVSSEWVISLCWNFQDSLISYIPFFCKIFIKIWDRSCTALVHLTWNDPLLYYIGNLVTIVEGTLTTQVIVVMINWLAQAKFSL